MPTSDAQKKATQAYRERNREKTRRQSYLASAKLYINSATLEEIRSLKNTLKEREEELMTKINKVELIRYLMNGQSIGDVSGGEATYYVHVTEDGEIVADKDQADKTFTATRDISAYADDEDMEGIYTSEHMDDESFRDLVDSMIDEINSSEDYRVLADASLSEITGHDAGIMMDHDWAAVTNWAGNEGSYSLVRSEVLDDIRPSVPGSVDEDLNGDIPQIMETVTPGTAYTVLDDTGKEFTLLVPDHFE